MYKSVVDKGKIQKFGACSPLRPFSAARAVAEEWVDTASRASSSLAPEDRDSPSNLAKENLLEEKEEEEV
jgi:hypothetical protein